MKLKELLQKVSFDDIVPHIIAFEPEHVAQIPYYKEAYDILMHTEAAETDKQIIVEWVRDEDELCGETPCIYIGNCEGDRWPTNLGKEIVLGEGVEMSDVELAGRCMWSLTFYGYRPGDDFFDQGPHNRYQDEADRLSNKQFDNYARTKNGLSPKNHTPYALSWEEWRVYYHRKRHRNRMKQMRDHRQDKRIEKLERMAKVEQAIQQILSATDAIKRGQLEYLFDTRLIQEQDPHSRAYDRTRRMDYLWEILTKYTAPDTEHFTRTIVVLTTVPDCPLTNAERAMFDHIVALFTENTEVFSAVGTKEGLGTEAELFIVKSC